MSDLPKIKYGCVYSLWRSMDTSDIMKDGQDVYSEIERRAKAVTKRPIHVEGYTDEYHVMVGDKRGHWRFAGSWQAEYAD